MSLPQALAAAMGSRRQEDVAAALGVSQSKVSRWLTGTVTPSLDDIVSVEEACGRPRGFVLRAAGFVDDDSSTEAAIASDRRLDDVSRRLLLAALRSAVQDR